MDVMCERMRRGANESKNSIAAGLAGGKGTAGFGRRDPVITWVWVLSVQCGYLYRMLRITAGRTVVWIMGGANGAG